MELAERDRLILSTLDPDDRAEIEAVVDTILEDELPIREPIYIEAEAKAFDARAEDLPDDKKVVAWMVAAALRLRADPRAENQG